MNAVEIKKGIYWVGAIDREVRNFHGYLTQRGTSYNAYLIIDEKTTLVDTVKKPFYGEMLERIKDVTDPSKIDYIVSNHVEMDHSGALPEAVALCKKAAVITSPNGEKGLRKHYGKEWPFKVVETGGSVNIGKRRLKFVHTPMVHWPDSMATYIPEERLLLPNDAFGQHIASNERFVDEIGIDTVKEEAAKYYANIVLPYGAQVSKALTAVSVLDIDMIAPSHGLIWRKDLKDILTLYAKWARNATGNKAVVVYDSMWGSTEKMARAVAGAFKEKGIEARLFSLKECHISDVMTHVLDAEYICVGSPTLNNGVMPTVASFLTYMSGLAPKNRTGLAFGSYGWGGQSVPQIDEILSGCGFKMLEKIRAQYIPDEALLASARETLLSQI